MRYVKLRAVMTLSTGSSSSSSSSSNSNSNTAATATHQIASRTKTRTKNKSRNPERMENGKCRWPWQLTTDNLPAFGRLSATAGRFNYPLRNEQEANFKAWPMTK